MHVRLKPLNQQVMVLTGASSGIGLVTARMAAKKGVRLVLVARNQQALDQLAQEINAQGGQAIAVAADVADEDQLRRVADAAVQHFGGIDTWVNDAGISVYGPLMEVALDDLRRVFETNVWGVVNGSRIAVQHLRPRGGVLINVGSVVSDQAIPLQGIYSASKHAVQGFTNALRMELEKEGAPIYVTLIKPGSIDTPFVQHAKNYLPNEPDLPPPVYAPELVAEAILHCAERPQRDVFVGGGHRLLAGLGQIAPRLMDKLMESTVFRQQQKDRPSRGRQANSLYWPGRDLRERGGHEGHVFESSVYTQAALHPLISGAVIAGAGLAAVAVWELLKESPRTTRRTPQRQRSPELVGANR